MAGMRYGYGIHFLEGILILQPYRAVVVVGKSALQGDDVDHHMDHALTGKI